MSEEPALVIDLQKIYRNEYIQEFESGRHKAEGLTKEVLYQSRLQELAGKGFIRLAKKNVHWELPPKFPGKPLSEYVREIKG